MAYALPAIAAVLLALIAAGGYWIWKQYRFLRFLTTATDQLEGMLPGLQADMKAFEAAWQEAWERPEWEETEDHFGGPPCPELRAFYADPVHARTEDVRLFGPGAPAEGLPLRNYMPLALRWSGGFGAGGDRLPGDHVVAHPGDLEATVYVVDWKAGGPVYQVGRPDGARVRVADSLTQLLGWEHRPDPARRGA